MSLLLATLLVIDLPLGPGSETIATQLVAPYQHAETIDDGPWHLWDIRVQPRALLYAISEPHKPVAVTVHVDLTAAAEGSAAVEVQPVDHAPAGAIAAAEQVAKILRARLASDTVRFSTGAIEPGDGPVNVTPSTSPSIPPRAPPGGTPRWLAVLLLLALGTSLAVSRRHLYAALTRTSPRGAWLAFGLAACTGLLLAVMDDVVLHPNAHGWDTVRAVSGWTATPFPLWDRYGAMLIETGRLLGIFAEPGRETYVAARVASACSVLAMYGLALALWRSRVTALIATGLFATSPALLFVGRGEALSASGILLMLLAGWLLAAAARRRCKRLLFCGTGALVCLASFRLMGPIVAPCVGLLAFLAADDDVSCESVRWRRTVSLALAAAVLLASPHLWRMGWLMSAELAVRPGADVMPRTLIDSPMWTPFALLFMGVVGAAIAARHHAPTALLLVLWAVLGVLAPSSSSAFYQDQARYQVYAIPALALAAAYPLAAMTTWRLPLRVGALALWLTWFATGMSLAGEIQAVEQAEEVQLRAWRTLPNLLPEGAWLAVPVHTDGRARTSLPDVELLTARPDLRLVSLEEASKAHGVPLFWFEGLSCAARYPSEPPSAARDCVAAHRLGNLAPWWVTSVEAELPTVLAQRVTAIASSLSPMGGDPTQWNPRPFGPGPLRIGLYEMRSTP